MSDARPRFELHLREEVTAHAARRQREVVERLEDASYPLSVRTWPERVHRWSDGAVLDRFEEFQAWADDAGVDLAPFFGSRGVYSVEEDRQVDALAPPVCCLSVHRGDDLVAVYPHVDGGDSRTVTDALDALGDDPETVFGAVGVAD